jgi:hypothetical protein
MKAILPDPEGAAPILVLNTASHKTAVMSSKDLLRSMAISPSR